MPRSRLKLAAAFGLAALLAAALSAAAVLAADDRPDLLAYRGAGGPGDKSVSKDREASDQGYLGIILQPLSRSLRRAFDIPGSVDGILVTHVQDGSPAEQAGLKDEDVITRLDGRDVQDQEELTRNVRRMKPGTEVTITVWRDGKSLDLQARLGSVPETSVKRFVWEGDNGSFSFIPEPPEPPEPPGAPDASGPESPPELAEPPEPGEPDVPDMPFDIPLDRNMFVRMSRGAHLGVELQDLNEEIAPFFSAPEGKGALVWRVIEDSPAARAGLKAGDVIVEIEGKPVGGSQDLRDLLGDLDPGDSVALTFLRQGRSQTVTATLDKSDSSLWLAPGLLRGRGLDSKDFLRKTREWQHRTRDRLKELRIERRNPPRAFRNGRDSRNLKDAMGRLQEEMDRLQERLGRLKQDLEKLKD